MPQLLLAMPLHNREYWEPVEEGMPWNCSSDLKAAVDYMGDLMSSGKHHEVIKLKKKFGLQSLADDDFAKSVRCLPSQLALCSMLWLFFC